MYCGNKWHQPLLKTSSLQYWVERFHDVPKYYVSKAQIAHDKIWKKYQACSTPFIQARLVCSYRSLSGDFLYMYNVNKRYHNLKSIANYLGLGQICQFREIAVTTRLFNGGFLSFMLCSQLFRFSPTCSLLFVTVRHCSLLFVTVPNSSKLFFSKFQCNFTFVEKL